MPVTGGGGVTGGCQPRPPTAAPLCGTRQAAPPRGVPAPAHRHPRRPRAHSDLCTVTKGGDGGTGNRVQTTDGSQLVRKALSCLQQPGLDSRGTQLGQPGQSQWEGLPLRPPRPSPSSRPTSVNLGAEISPFPDGLSPTPSLQCGVRRTQAGRRLSLAGHSKTTRGADPMMSQKTEDSGTPHPVPPTAISLTYAGPINSDPWGLGYPRSPILAPASTGRPNVRLPPPSSPACLSFAHEGRKGPPLHPGLKCPEEADATGTVEVNL